MGCVVVPSTSLICPQRDGDPHHPRFFANHRGANLGAKLRFAGLKSEEFIVLWID
jgi:hypothetical protein